MLNSLLEILLSKYIIGLYDQNRAACTTFNKSTPHAYFYIFPGQICYIHLLVVYFSFIYTQSAFAVFQCFINLGFYILFSYNLVWNDYKKQKEKLSIRNKAIELRISRARSSFA